MKQIKEHSAGGVVWRQKEKERKKKEEGVTEWLISKHGGYHKWVLPKGVVEEGETGPQAALREVEEETGIKTEIIKKIDFEVRYKYTKNIFGEDNRKPLIVNRKLQDEGGILVDKTVEFYLMKYVSGDVKDHSWEMEEAKWVNYKEAMKLLGFPGEREIIAMAMEAVVDEFKKYCHPK